MPNVKVVLITMEDIVMHLDGSRCQVPFRSEAASSNVLLLLQVVVSAEEGHSTKSKKTHSTSVGVEGYPS